MSNITIKLPDKPIRIDNPNELINIVIKEIRDNRAQLYITYTVKIGDAEINGSVDASKEFTKDDIFTLVKCDVLKQDQARNPIKDVITDAFSTAKEKIIMTRAELYDSLPYPKVELTIENKTIENF